MSSAVAGRYRVERTLGRGAMARVDLARDAELDRLVALKVLAPELAADPELRARFVREGRLAARLSHPNVVAVLDAGEEDALPFIVMEYVEGESLAERLQRDGALPWPEAVGLAEQALAGLEHAHAAGLVHRDVKPGNLLLRRDGQLKVGDFGVARAVEATALTAAGTILGTAAYLAPEQARGERVGPTADVYGAAAVLYELLSGRPPRRIESLADLAAAPDEPIAPLRELVPSVPAHVEEAVMRGLAADPRHRPSAAGLRSLLAGEPATAVLRPAPSPAGSGRRRLVPWLAAAAATAVLLVAAAAAVTRGEGAGPEPPAEPAPAEPVGPQPGATPEETARNLGAWLRAHAAGG